MLLSFCKIILSVLKPILQDILIVVLKKPFTILTSQTKLATGLFRLFFLVSCGSLAFFPYKKIIALQSEINKIKKPNQTHFRSKNYKEKLQNQLPFLLNDCGDNITISSLYFDVDINKKNTSIYNTFDFGFVQMLDKEKQIMIDLQIENPNNLPQTEIDKKHKFYQSSHAIYGDFNTLLSQAKNYSYFCFTKDNQHNASSVLNTQCFIVNEKTNPIIKYAFDNLQLNTIWAIVVKENEELNAAIDFIITFGVVKENYCSPKETQKILKQIAYALAS